MSRRHEFINISIWTDFAAAKQMHTLPEMLAERPITEQAGMQFDAIANEEEDFCGMLVLRTVVGVKM